MATILIANSDHRFTEILRKVLLAYHHEVLTARTGEEALQLFETKHPVVVILDLAILGMPGLDVLTHLKARSPRLPVVILTSEVSIEVEDRVREMGVLDVLRKRLKLDVTMRAVNHALERAGRPPRAAPAVAKPTRAATILIVDDEPEICELVGEFLQRRGYRIKTAANGEAALTLVRQERPDLVLLDIYMPGMNGVDVLREFMREKSPVAVIMLTASQEEPLLQAALDLGAFDVLPKPVDLDQVELAVMVKLLLSEPDDAPVSHR